MKLSQEIHFHYNYLSRVRIQFNALFYKELSSYFLEESILFSSLSSMGRDINLIKASRKEKLSRKLFSLYKRAFLYFFGKENFKLAQKYNEILNKFVDDRSNIISNSFNHSYSNHRTMKIARTEVNTILNFGLYAKAYEEKKTKKLWIASQGERHLALHLEEKNLLEPYSNGLLFPGQGATPNQIINCRCFQFFI